MTKDLVLPCVPYGDSGDPFPPYGSPPTMSVPDVLEAALSHAMAEYRFKAEEILDEHRDKLDAQERVHQLEIATLKAENAKLREKLSIKADGLQGGGLFQAVVLQMKEDEQCRRKKKPDFQTRLAANEERKDAMRRPSSLNVNGNRGGQPQRLQHTLTSMNSAAEGRWEQFVAWVPNGAALQQPHPWRPLSDDTIVNTDAETDQDKTDEERYQQYELLEVWTVSREEEARERRRKRREAGNDDSVSEFCNDMSVRTESVDDLFQNTGQDGCTLHPHSNPRIAWDMTSLFLTIYDMIMIPMMVFDMSHNVFLVLMSWGTRWFWTLDMGMSCVTGIVMVNGAVNLERRYIVRRYVETWLLLDCFIVGFDWGEYAYSQILGGNGTGVGQATKIFRIIRVIRLLRLAKMKEVVGQITERIQSDNLAYLLHVFKLTLVVVSTAHVMACIWWGISTASPNSWAHKSGYSERSVDVQYLISLHWALSQFSGGMDEVTPVGTWERFYAVSIWLFAFMASAVLMSMLTSSLTQMHIVGGNVARQMSLLRKFLKQNQISSNLALRMQRSAQHSMSGDLTPDLVELLGVVSEPLRVEMHFEMYSDAFRKHPFFGDFIIESPTVMRRVCYYATTSLFFSIGDVVFTEGEAPAQPKMYFVMKGKLDYLNEDNEILPITEGQWLAEGTLWTTWVYKGTLTATSDVKLAVLDANTFQDLVKRFKGAVSPSFDPKRYAANFVNFLNEHEDSDDCVVMKYSS